MYIYLKRKLCTHCIFRALLRENILKNAKKDCRYVETDCP